MISKLFQSFGIAMLMVIGISLLISLSPKASAKELESYYQNIWCTDKGVVEYILEDRARIDCLTDEYAVEVDFQEKWAESIGQSLLYANMTGKKPAVLLIVNDKAFRYLTRFHNATKELDITLFVIEE